MQADTPNTPDVKFLKEIFLHHLDRIYNGKCFLRKKLAHLVSLASFKGLQLAIEEFADDIKKQISRMEEVYKLIGETATDADCNPIRSIVQDEFCIDENQAIPLLNDLDLALYIQVLERVHITSYRMLIMIATLLKEPGVKQLLVENLDESTDNDKLFALLAKEYISPDL